MSGIAVDYLDEAIERAIGYCRVEFDMTYGEIVGELEFYKAKIIKEAFALGDEDSE